MIKFIYKSDEELRDYVDIPVNSKDSFGIPMMFASKFWGGDVRGDIARLEQDEYLYQNREQLFNAMQKKINSGDCFRDLSTAAEKFSDERTWLIADSYKLRISPQTTSDYVLLESAREPLKFKTKDIMIPVKHSMSTAKMLVTISELSNLINEYDYVDVFGRLNIHFGEEQPYSVTIKPFLVGFDLWKSMAQPIL